METKINKEKIEFIQKVLKLTIKLAGDILSLKENSGLDEKEWQVLQEWATKIMIEADSIVQKLKVNTLLAIQNEE